LDALDAQAGYRYTFITYKLVGAAVYHHQPAQYWIQELVPENYVVMHVEDARREGFTDGDMVKLVSASNPEGTWDLKNGRRYPVGGKLKTTTGIRQGVVAVSGHYGHWAYGAVDTIVDGQVIQGDPRRGTGINPNVIIRLDPVLKDVTPSDPVGGQQAIPTRVNVVRMTSAEIAQLRTHVPGSVLVEGLTTTYLGGA
jgi:anaerobic selenocysteine-containing dehydrogenase